MAIRFDTVTMDEQKLPVVSWEEDRNIFAPEGIGPARVACFIRPDKESGELMFVAAGSVRHGDFEEARPWELLHSFEPTVADQHYRSAHERVILDTLGRKNSLTRIVLTDGAHVMLATFTDERASVGMHINCASASPVEVALLHDRLRREFIDKRHRLCDRLLRRRLYLARGQTCLQTLRPAGTGQTSRLGRLACQCRRGGHSRPLRLRVLLVRGALASIPESSLSKRSAA